MKSLIYGKKIRPEQKTAKEFKLGCADFLNFWFMKFRVFGIF